MKKLIQLLMKKITDINFLSRLIILAIMVIIILSTLTGCAFDSDATVASYNVSKEADQFRVKRRIVFVNLRSDTYLFSITGNCSVETDNTDNQLEVICKVGEDQYQKHFLYLSNETTYTIEQLDYTEASKYDYEIIFKPENIIPIEIKTE